jgi:hypothetical protein
MALLTSGFSALVVVAVPFTYTTAILVSQSTGGEIPPEDVLPEWLQQARDEVDRRTGMCFRTLTQRDFLDGTGLDVIFLDCFPVIEILHLFIEGQEVSPAAFKFNPRTGSVRLADDLFPDGFRNVEVEYVRGTRAVPPVVQKIATLLVAKTALSAKNGPLTDSESIGDFSQSRSFKKMDDELDRAWETLGRRFPIHFI